QQVLERARELAERGANDTLDATSRRALADEANVLWEHLLQVANTAYKGRYLFGGAQTLQPPFVPDPNDPGVIQYQGDQVALERRLGSGDTTVIINVTGWEAFQQ